MPPKSKKRRGSAEAAMKAREALKKARTELETSPSATQPSLFSTIGPQSKSLTVGGPNTPIRTENEGVSEAGPSTEMPMMVISHQIQADLRT